MDKLSPEQQKIASTFPKDLDEEGGSLLKTAVHMCKDWRSFVRWKYLHYYVLLVFLCVLVALMTIYHRQIVDWLTPASQKVRTLSWGWVIPVIILFILSFPPLFGHEIVGVLCGVVYGLWVGFGILSLGTLLGELGNFYGKSLEVRLVCASHHADHTSYPRQQPSNTFCNGMVNVSSKSLSTMRAWRTSYVKAASLSSFWPA
jgi:hypothetical protein